MENIHGASMVFVFFNILFLSSSLYHSVSVFLSYSSQLYRLLFLLSLLSLFSIVEWQLVEKQFIYYLINNKKKIKKKFTKKKELFRFVRTIEKRMLVCCWWYFCCCIHTKCCLHPLWCMFRDEAPLWETRSFVQANK